MNPTTIQRNCPTMVFLMKIVLMGDGAVGKTAIRERYLGKGFQSTYMMTIGADFAIKEQEIHEKTVKFQIWDLAGQTRFGAVRSVYYLGCLGGLLLYDVTRPESYQNLTSWIQEYWKNNGKGIIPVVILGNKVDLRDQFPNSISPEQGQEFCEKLSEQTNPHGFETKYLETSAKTGLNIQEAFHALGEVYFKFVEDQTDKL